MTDSNFIDWESLRQRLITASGKVFRLGLSSFNTGSLRHISSWPKDADAGREIEGAADAGREA